MKKNCGVTKFAGFFPYEMVKRNEIYAMKLRLRENLCFELKIQFKNHSIYVVKLPPFPPGTGIQNFGDGGPGDGYFFSHPGVRNSSFGQPFLINSVIRQVSKSRINDFDASK